MSKKSLLGKQHLKSALKFAAKIALSALAIYIVFTKIDLGQVWNLIRASSIGLLVLALVFFNLSKIWSSHRLLELFKAVGVNVDRRYNLKLYYIGMFYNLFLPGGIGGDGYKVYHLKSRSESTTRLLIAAVLLDRVSGAAILGLLALAILSFYPGLFVDLPVWVYPGVIAGLFLALPALWLVFKLFFPSFRSVFGSSTLWSLGVQAAQLACALAILYAFGVSEYVGLYLALFLISNVAAMLPLSFGGIGLRELVFLFAAAILPIDQTAAVALGLMFFIITALSSFAGVFIKLPSNAG